MVAQRPENPKALYEALIALADRCDGAREEDGIGFNGCDSAWGKSLANQIRSRGYLTANQEAKALPMLQKYRKQLAAIGIKLPTELEARKPILRSAPAVESIEDESTVRETIEQPHPLEEGLSEQQVEAFRQCRAWFRSGGKTPFVLKGFAGVGKSFTVQRIVKSLKQDNPDLRIALIAPTNKAAQVLMDFARSAGIEDLVYISTAFQLCALRPGRYTRDGKRMLEAGRRKMEEPSYTDFDLVVCDETSMAGNVLLKHMPFHGNDRIRFGKKVPTLFMGDTAQLPPVPAVAGEDENGYAIMESLDQSPVFDFPGSIQLSQVIRYEGEILKLATRMRENLDERKLPAIPNTGNVCKMNGSDWLETLQYEFGLLDIRKEPNKIRALAWTNERVQQINEQVRSVLFPNSTRRYEEGERLMAKESLVRRGIYQNPYTGAQEETASVLMYSCEECTVSSAETEKRYVRELKSEVKLYRLTVDTDRETGIVLPVVHDESMGDVYNKLGEWREKIKSFDKYAAKAEWDHYNEFLEDYNLLIKSGKLIHRLQYAYGLTTYQSQGGTFNWVFVDLKNICGCRDIRLRNKMLYTACTRASEQLFVLSNY